MNGFREQDVSRMPKITNSKEGSTKELVTERDGFLKTERCPIDMK